jgi:hypothetical protein
METLILVATHGGPTMFARIGILRALNRHVERVFNPDRKDTNWTKRKLKRDQVPRGKYIGERSIRREAYLTPKAKQGALPPRS